MLPPDLALGWVSPAWTGEGVTVMFQHLDGGEHPTVRQELLKLTSACPEPDDAAADMADQLLATAPTDWVRRFGWDPR